MTPGEESKMEQDGVLGVKVTPEQIQKTIVAEYYFTGKQGVWAGGNAPPNHIADRLGLLTICILVLRNGFTVTGESACVSAEVFNEELGKKLARSKAVDKVWMLEGYLLAEFKNDAMVAP